MAVRLCTSKFKTQCGIWAMTILVVCVMLALAVSMPMIHYHDGLEAGELDQIYNEGLDKAAIETATLKEINDLGAEMKSTENYIETTKEYLEKLNKYDTVEEFRRAMPTGLSPEHVEAQVEAFENLDRAELEEDLSRAEQLREIQKIQNEVFENRKTDVAVGALCFGSIVPWLCGFCASFWYYKKCQDSPVISLESDWIPWNPQTTPFGDSDSDDERFPDSPNAVPSNAETVRRTSSGSSKFSTSAPRDPNVEEDNSVSSPSWQSVNSFEPHVNEAMVQYDSPNPAPLTRQPTTNLRRRLQRLQNKTEKML